MPSLASQDAARDDYEDAPMPDDGVPMSMAPLEDDSIATASAAQPDGFDYDAAEYEADQALSLIHI